MASRSWVLLEGLEERLNRGRYDMCYCLSDDVVASQVIAELEGHGIPACLSVTEDGPVIKVSSKYRQRAERLVPALTAADHT